MLSLRLSVGAALLMAAVPARVSAGESFDNCIGYIDSLPVTISSQGTWCLRHDLTTAMTSGAAILVQANNVTLDCNDFKIGGLAAGTASTADGVLAENRVNTTVRRCSIRGFYRGVALGGSGHLVQSNRLDQNLRFGIHVTGDDNLVRDNRVYDTGGAAGLSTARGISVSGDSIDNTVAGVFAAVPDGFIYGLVAYGNGSVSRGNTVRGMASSGPLGAAIGIVVVGAGHRLENNHVYGTGATPGSIGLSVGDTPGTACVENSVEGFATSATNGCYPGGNNLFN